MSGWPDSFATAAVDRDAFLRAVDRITERWPAELPPLERTVAALGEAGPPLAHLLSISPVSVEKLIRDPAALVWLAQPGLLAGERGVGRMRADLVALGWTPLAVGGIALKPPHFAPLRRWKQREMLRIALREVAGWAAVEQSTLELTCVAELCVREVLAAWMADLQRRFGDPGTGFCVLGMGKLGGQELNYSSDIDVIFFHGEPGDMPGGLTRQEFFTRLAQGIIGTFSATDAAGPLFRIDLRLRPEGDGGPLVRSLDGMEDYYAAFGETWERMALGKARLVAGDEELAYEFFQRHQAFIYPRAVGPDMLDEIARIKGRIEREIVGAGDLHRNVKLGRGGIREIEFTCQSLQLLHGARHAFLQERSTLKALRGLEQLSLLSREEARDLAGAYRFLRTVEHRLQIEDEAQTHSLPGSPEAMSRLARSLGFADIGEFEARLAEHTGRVRAIFEGVVRLSAVERDHVRDLGFFADPQQAQRSLAELGGESGAALMAPRSKKLFARIEPRLLAVLGNVPDPDATLVRLVRFTARYGFRGALFETLLVNPRVLELLVKLFDASAVLSEIAIRRPQLVEEVARLGNLGESIPVAGHLAALAKNDEGLPWTGWVRAYRRAQELRIGLRDLLGFAPLTEVFTECTALAEACLLFTQHQLGLDDALTVIALGKFGGRELAYGADLDVIFIGSDPQAAAALLREMTKSTEEGRIFPMDARLRPDGEKGQLAVTLAEWSDYFARGRGQLWEAQSLTKARPLSGPAQDEWLAAAQEVWRGHGRRRELSGEIAGMLDRIAEHRGGDRVLDFKTGPGGLMQLEFFIQARQMQAGIWEPNTLEALNRLDLPAGTAQTLRDGYLFLRQVETVLRRMDCVPVSSLPADPSEQARLARRCGIAGAAAL
ncbi:MAG: putative nucleotidyltransferase substrate binding domain-containing protein, partial [Chthoniobacteraceae bacterium]